jgi:hypothetical protein
LLSSACAQRAEVSKPAFATSDIVTERATVLAVNRPERMVVLRGEDGGTLGLILDERVRNFDQIQVGDVVTAQYQEATAIFVRPSTGAPTSDQTGTLQTARPGEKPGAVATRTNEITATVVSIDYPNRMADSNSVTNTTSAQRAGEVDAEATTEADGGGPGYDRTAAEGWLGCAGHGTGAWPVAQRDQCGDCARP